MASTKFLDNLVPIFQAYYSGGTSVIRNMLAVVLCTVVTLGVPFPCPSAETKVLVIMIDHGSSGFVYRVNGKVTTADLLTFLDEHKPDWPSDKTKVVLLVHERVTLKMINNSRGMIIKAGYEPPRVFYYGNDKRSMLELTFSPEVPFSQIGEVPK
jgi:hypothetical protein